MASLEIIANSAFLLAVSNKLNLIWPVNLDVHLFYFFILIVWLIAPKDYDLIIAQSLVKSYFIIQQFASLMDDSCWWHVLQQQQQVAEKPVYHTQWKGHILVFSYLSLLLQTNMFQILNNAKKLKNWIQIKLKC